MSVNKYNSDGSFTVLADRTQYDTMPTATSELLGAIIQYTGATTQDYIKGFFYRACVSESDPTQYEWKNINVQNSANEFYGTYSEWNELTLSEKITYTKANLI